MKAFIFFIAVLVVCHVSLANSTELLTLLLKQSENLDCVGDGLQCKNSNELQYCSLGKPLFTTKCVDQDPTKPYCDLKTNMCTSTNTNEPPVDSTNFICPNAGYYPDLLNCSKNHYCDAKGSNSTGSEECPKGSIYDQKLEFCNPYALCRTYSSTTGLCKGNINKFVPYTPSPNLYVFCTTDNPILLECLSKDLEFDVSSVKCIFKCKANGRFLYPGDDSKYYHCVYISNSYVQQILECPDETKFDQEAKNGNGKCLLPPATPTEAP